MARYKTIDTSPRFLTVDLEAQLLPGTFEHALHRLLDHDVDLSAFDARFANDETGAPAYPPAMLLKVVLLAYSRGIVSSRGIERACQNHVSFSAGVSDSSHVEFWCARLRVVCRIHIWVRLYRRPLYMQIPVQQLAPDPKTSAHILSLFLDATTGVKYWHLLANDTRVCCASDRHSRN